MKVVARTMIKRTMPATAKPAILGVRDEPRDGEEVCNDVTIGVTIVVGLPSRKEMKEVVTVVRINPLEDVEDGERVEDEDGDEEDKGVVILVEDEGTNVEVVEVVEVKVRVSGVGEKVDVGKKVVESEVSVGDVLKYHRDRCE